eukprot:782926-Pleurochrysis_carterae.AAC.1
MKIVGGQYSPLPNSAASLQLRGVISSMLSQRPRDRPSAQQVCAHSILGGSDAPLTDRSELTRSRAGSATPRSVDGTSQLSPVSSEPRVGDRQYTKARQKKLTSAYAAPPATKRRKPALPPEARAGGHRGRGAPATRPASAGRARGGPAAAPAAPAGSPAATPRSAAAAARPR